VTIEFSLRRRSERARLMAGVWLSLATLILVGTYISLPIIANATIRTFNSIDSGGGKAGPSQQPAESKSFHVEIYAVGVLALGLVAVGFACFLLGRTAFVEIEMAARFSGLADALCIAGDNFEHLEKATELLMPATKYLSVPEIFSTKDLDSVVEVLKQLRPK
jgi:hypothetical protein